MPTNPPKYTDLDYIKLIIATSIIFCYNEVARCFLSIISALSHGCFSLLLQNLSSDTEPLLVEVRKFVTSTEGYLIVDDTMLNKLHSKMRDFVQYNGVGSIIVKLREFVLLPWSGQMVRIPYLSILSIMSMKTIQPRVTISVILTMDLYFGGHLQSQ